MPSVKKICVVTGSRAEYGLLYWIMKGLKENPAFQLQLVVTAGHLAPEFGLTYKQIEADGFTIDQKIDMLQPGDSPVSITKSVGTGLIRFAEVYEQLKPGLILLLGDRFEALAAAQAALLAKIPLAHIHGGELTEGAIDDSIRHAISKMAQIHFVATEAYRRRVIQMGEQPGNVYTTGAPGIDNIKRLQLLSKTELENKLEFELSGQIFLVTYHPETLAAASIDSKAIQHLLTALDAFQSAQIVITFPNADAGHKEIIKQIKAYADRNPGRVFTVPSLGQLNYLSLLQFVDLVIGNSSSGVIEAPTLKKPAINIGHRQKGRIKAGSVIDCDADTGSVISAIKTALSDEFKNKLIDMENPYGDGTASAKIIDILQHIDPQKLLAKSFYDIDFILDKEQ